MAFGLPLRVSPGHRADLGSVRIDASSSRTTIVNQVYQEAARGTHVVGSGSTYEEMPATAGASAGSEASPTYQDIITSPATAGAGAGKASSEYGNDSEEDI